MSAVYLFLKICKTAQKTAPPAKTGGAVFPGKTIRQKLQHLLILIVLLILLILVVLLVLLVLLILLVLAVILVGTICTVLCHVQYLQ